MKATFISQRTPLRAPPQAPHLHRAWQEAQSLCIKCGFCLPACPTYRETGREAASPRGRLDLMYAAAQGLLAVPAVEPHLALCLGCQACETACPSGIRYHDMLEAARADVTALPRHQGLGAGVRRALLGALSRPRLLRALVWGLWAYQASGAQALLRGSHLLRLLAPPLARLERGTPPLERPRRWHPREDAPAGSRPVQMLAGCIMDVAFAPVHAATEHVLRANGWRVQPVPGQTCCGALHLHAGEPELARALARRNIAAFEAAGDAPLLVNSAGCGAVLKQYGHLLADDPAWAPRAARLAGRVKDVLEFLAQRPLAPARGPGAGTLTVAYDDACHLLHAQGIREQPRALLAQVPGLKLVPLREAEMCCGSAGSYSLQQPAMAQALLARKMEHVAASGAQVLATGNPGCLLQLKLGVRQRGLGVQVLHPVELLSRAYGRA